MFLTVWLRRQEAEVNKARLLAQGLSDIASALPNGESHVAKVFKDLVASMYPSTLETRSAEEKKLVETMKKEVEKGPISFQAIKLNTYKNVVKKFSIPEEFRERMREASAKRARRR